MQSERQTFRTPSRVLGLALAVAVLAGLVSGSARAQSTAANGAIEGTVADNSGGVLPGVTVTVTNTDTGTQRAVVTNDAGLYRATLLPLGTYRVVAELQGFKKFEQVGVTVGAGQTASVDVKLEVGDLNEVVSMLGCSGAGSARSARRRSLPPRAGSSGPPRARAACRWPDRPGPCPLRRAAP